MARGVSLHIGLNEVDPAHYRDAQGNPWRGTLNACENDARAMVELARAQGFEVRGPLLTAQATSDSVLAELHKTAQDLTPGDMFFLTYSGHGSQIDNKNPDDDLEEDKLDETWCLFDRELLDDELFAVFSEFQAGVRILVLSDSCHSGSVTRAEPPDDQDGEAKAKALPMDVALATERGNAVLYDALQKEIPSKRLTSMAATVVLLSGCEDDQFSRDGRQNGAFTSALLEAWKDPEARRSLRRLVTAVSAGIPATFNQVPNYLVYGFDAGPALTI